MVIDGESRLAAARQLGLASVPCIRVDHLNESEQRLLRLAVNRLGEKGSWDIAELEVEFKELIIAEAPPCQAPRQDNRERIMAVFGKSEKRAKRDTACHRSTSRRATRIGCAQPRRSLIAAAD
jgi:ParB-like chromosome segregation protein Spo0J